MGMANIFMTFTKTRSVMQYIYIYMYATLCMGRSKAIGEQYLDIAGERGQYLDIAQEHLFFDLHFDL